MDVHHIVECWFFDDDDKRNDLRNLVTLCISCHKLWEGATDEEQIEKLRDVLKDQSAEERSIEGRLSWVKEQQERLKQ